MSLSCPRSAGGPWWNICLYSSLILLPDWSALASRSSPAMISERSFCRRWSILSCWRQVLPACRRLERRRLSCCPELPLKSAIWSDRQKGWIRGVIIPALDTDPESNLQSFGDSRSRFKSNKKWNRNTYTGWHITLIPIFCWHQIESWEGLCGQ